jgi:hypothetical protein
MNDRYARGAGNPDTSEGTADRGRAKLGTKLRETTKSRRDVGAAGVSPLTTSFHNKYAGQVDRGQLNCRRLDTREAVPSDPRHRGVRDHR